MLFSDINSYVGMHILNLLLFIRLASARSQYAIIILLIIVPSETLLSEGSPYKITTLGIAVLV